MTALVVFSLFSSVLVTSWTALQTDAMNTTSFAVRQNDQMRAMDYLKRDIRRASTVAIYNGATLITTAGTYGSTLQLTIPGYYSDTRLEDDSHGTRVANSPTYTSGKLGYGTAMTVRYYTLNGAVMRSEASASSTTRIIADATGNFIISFATDTSNFLHSKIDFDQRMRSGSNRSLRRQLSFTSNNHSQFAQ